MVSQLSPRPALPAPRAHPELPLFHLVLLAPPRLLQEGYLGRVLGELRGLRKERKPRLFPERFQHATREGRVTYFGIWCPIPGQRCPSPAVSEAAPRRGCRVHPPPKAQPLGGFPPHRPPYTLRSLYSPAVMYKRSSGRCHSASPQGQPPCNPARGQRLLPAAPGS